MGKVVKAVVGVAVAAVGVVTGNPALIFAGVSMAVGSLLQPKVKTPKRQAQENVIQIGESPRMAIFGEMATGGTLVDGFNYGGQYGTDWEVLVIALADHRCEALTGFYVNDKYVAFGGSGAVAGYNGQLEVTFQPGTESQTVPAVLTSYGGWASTDQMKGVAHVVVAYKVDDEKAKNPIWTGGRPRFTWVVKGKRCYDPRLDSTVPGGSGAHRWDDPTTWQWTDNLIVCRYNWVRGVYACDRVGEPDQLLVGRGLSAVEAPPERIFAAANLCDELVSLDAGGTEKRYRVAALVHADEAFGDVEDRFAAACAGVIAQPEGGVEIEPGQAKSAVFAFTDDDIIVGTKTLVSEFRSEADGEWLNTVVPRYVEPAQQWQDHAAPVRRVYADVIADGGPREEVLNLDMVTSGTQAQRVAEIRRRLGRLLRTAQVTLGPRFAAVEEGDWGTWTSARYLGGGSVTFRVDGFALGKEWRNTLQLREIASSVYSWSTVNEGADGAVAEQQDEPDVSTAPPATDWALSGGSIASSPALVITGQSSDPRAQAILFEYRVFDAGNGPDDNWISTGPESPGLTSKIISGVSVGVQYDVAVSYQIAGTWTARRVIGTGSNSNTASITGWGSTNSISYGPVIGGPVTVRTGAVGAIDIDAPLLFYRQGSGGSPLHAYGKWQYRTPAGAGAWTDAAAEVLSTTSSADYTSPGAIDVGLTLGSLTADTEYELQFLARRQTSGSNYLQFSGTAAIQGS